MINEILEILPSALKIKLESFSNLKSIREIRIRVNRNVILMLNSNYSLNDEYEIEYTPTLKDILEILLRISKNSIYAIQNDINNGFVTIKGGHRIGICGEVVIEDGKVKNIKNINSLNIRVANQVIGVADSLYKEVVCNGKVKNTLIVSPPRIWKDNNA